MLDWYYQRTKDRLFKKTQFDPEEAHDYVIWKLGRLGYHPVICRLLEYIYDASTRYTHCNVMGMAMRNPVGLAAGLDKNCVAARALAALGFGSLELGAVLPKAQEGNLRPRVVRNVSDQTVINGMGFPSVGVEAVGRNCWRWSSLHIPVGCNLGKNRDTPLEKTAEDMALVMTMVYVHFDWFTINVSSPNTPGLRSLGVGDFLSSLVGECISRADAIAKVALEKQRKRIVVKLSPDLTYPELIDAVERCVDAGVSGICLGNTRAAPLPDGRPGGLSGRVLYGRTFEMVKIAAPLTHGKCALIACGGINSADKVKQLLDHGADMVQILTTLFFDGPGQVWRIVHDLSQALAQQAVGENLNEKARHLQESGQDSEAMPRHEGTTPRVD